MTFVTNVGWRGVTAPYTAKGVKRRLVRALGYFSTVSVKIAIDLTPAARLRSMASMAAA